jgi:hypothetical protein
MCHFLYNSICMVATNSLAVKVEMSELGQIRSCPAAQERVGRWASSRRNPAQAEVRHLNFWSRG